VSRYFRCETQTYAHLKPQRIEPFGWDSDDRTYIVLDDNRLYRRTDPPPPLPTLKSKKNTRKSKASARRTSKRIKISEPEETEVEEEDTVMHDKEKGCDEDDTFGGAKWECLAVTLEDFRDFLSTIEKSKDPNEKILRKRIMDDLLPILEKQEEAQKRKAVQKQKELFNLERLATAKRSSRIAGKVEQQKQEEDAKEAERKRHADLLMAKKEQEKWQKLEKERESRMMTREQRLKEREAKRILHEEELANLSEDSKKLESGEGRISERHLKAEIERKKQELEQLAEEEDWIFDCICGAYGQIDDGTHSISCENCNIWQHSKCVDVSKADAEREDFHFICTTCKRRAEEAKAPKANPAITLKFTRPGSSSAATTGALKDDAAIGQQPHATISANGHTPGSAAYSPQKPTAAGVTQTDNSASMYGNGRLDFKQPQLSFPDALLAGNVQSPEKTSPPAQRPGKVPVFGGASPEQNIQSPSAAVNAHHTLSSPHPYSPTSLPPPSQPKMYSFINGHPTHVVSPSTAQKQQTPFMDHNSARANMNIQQTPLAATPGGSRNGQHNRRSSVSMPSPLVGAPVLSPAQYKKDPNIHNQSSSPTKLPSSPITSQISPLPPAVTGLSPTKHSPPRPTAANGLEQRTPSILPPVAPLSPSPQAQNLSPPVKTAIAEPPSSGLGIEFQPQSQAPPQSPLASATQNGK
jgi:hypothetical protein